MSDLNSDFSSAFIATISERSSPISTCSFETSVCRVFSKESADTFITSSFCKVKGEARKSMNFGAAGGGHFVGQMDQVRHAVPLPEGV
ncbi:hypothetical protein Lepil_3505 [Leptonema illini DSM 21528]|uniref:Uncharacterized protein n=1 Tax=Leptonema illini DSM 21528 TaxID=929563 RepID=H2CJK2_9LEPT|nr:hypothetical protein Lepil_3505 [Leptonema illini DSM 21528]